MESVARSVQAQPGQLRPALPTRVVKLGGSLVILPDLVQRLESWQAAENAKRQMNTLLVVGGGKLVDTVRELASVHTFDDVAIHYECIRLLSHTARMVQLLLSGVELLQSTTELQQFLQAKLLGKTTIVDVAGIYSFIEQHAAIPESWATTSDALAAGLAVAIQAEELCLLKSAEPPCHPDGNLAMAERQSEWHTKLAAAGYVDLVFPEIAASLPPTRFVNLRSLPD